MKKILNFDGFINESFFGTYVAFIFIPVDKNFNSTIYNPAISETKTPSEYMDPNSYGYLLLPVTAETANILKNLSDADDTLGFTKSPDESGFIITNYNDPTLSSRRGIKSVSANVTGMMQNISVYMTKGSAYIMDRIMRGSGWEQTDISKISTRIANGFPKNTALEMEYFGGLLDAVESLKTLIGISTFSDGLSSKHADSIIEYLLYLFQNSPADFITMNLPQDVVDRVKQAAVEKNPEHDISKTIDNLEDLKSSGLFDD